MAHETTNQNNDRELVGVINPYALAELVSGRTIKWADGADSRHVLEEVLGMPYEQLFDPIHDSPLYLGVRLKEDLTLERARPAVLDVDLPRNGNDLDRYSFGDTRSLRKVGDLGPYFDTNDITELSIDWAELVEPGVLRLRITRATESRLAQLARVFTPRIVTSVVHVPDFQPVDDIVLEPPVSYWGDYGSFFAEAVEFFDRSRAQSPAATSSRPCRPSLGHTRTGSVTSPEPPAPGRTGSLTTCGSTTSTRTRRPMWRSPTKYSNNRPMYARSSEEGETWPAILEKAYAKWESGASGDTPDIASTAFGSPTRACSELTGLTKFAVATQDTSADDLWSLVRQNSFSRRTVNPMVAATYRSGEIAPDKVVYSDANLVANHCYTVLGWDYRNGKKYIILRNPWGSTEATLGSLDATVLMYDVSWWRPIILTNPDGVFGLEISVFKSYFKGLGGAR